MFFVCVFNAVFKTEVGGDAPNKTKRRIDYEGTKHKKRCKRKQLRGNRKENRIWTYDIRTCSLGLAGNVIGQVLTIVFSVLYGIISFRTKYYGEMLTYLLMSAPAAGAAVIAWLKHPFNGDKTQVEINHLSCRECIFMTFLAAVTTVAFHFILKHFNTAQLFFGTLSVTTSFFASYLAFRRSPFYAFAYAANDIVLIILWMLASAGSNTALPMVACFVAFLANDIYGFVNWMKMKKYQAM